MILNSERIQRIEPPKANMTPRLFQMPFGGGGHGLTPEAVEELIPILSFDYMGRSEFEWSALPECLTRINGNQKDYTKSAVEYSGKTFHIFAPSKVIDQCIEDIQTLAKSGSPAMIRESLQGKYKTVAWLDIVNDVFFTTDKEMFDKFLIFLEIE